MAPSIFKRMFLYLFHFHFYILIVYHREHVLIFSWHQKRSIYSCWTFGRRLFRWIKTTLALPQPACAAAAANLLWSHCAAVWIERETNGKRKKKGCCYILSSGQGPCWEPSRKGMYSIDPWWDETVTLLQGENKFSCFCFQSFSFFFLFFFNHCN